MKRVTTSVVSVVACIVLLAGCGSVAPTGMSSVTPVTGAATTTWGVPVATVAQTETAPADATSEEVTSPATAMVSATPVVSHGSDSRPVNDYVSLADALQTRGITVSLAGEISHDFFAVTGQVLNVPGGDIQVFEYPDESVVQQDAQTVGPDGSAIGTSMVDWIAPPHFYRKGKLMVLYIGSDTAVMSALESFLGKPFAGS